MSEWVSVKERFPEEAQYILTFSPNPYSDEPKMALCLYVPEDKRFDFLSSGCGCCDDSHHNVTHWMPLPEAPEMSPDPIDIYGKSVLLSSSPKEAEEAPENQEGAVFIPLGIGYWAIPARGLPPSPTPPPEEAPK